MNSRRISALKIAVAVAMVAIVVGCKPSVPEQYIQPDDMEAILYDYYVSKAVANKEGDDYERNLYYLATLKKHGVSEAEFDSSLVYYYTHADQLAKIYKSLSDRMSDEAKQMGASVGEMGEYANLKANGDTANVWRDATTAVLTTVAPYNRIDFSLNADTTYHRGDSFMLDFMTNYMIQSGTKDATAYMAVTYTDDSVAVSHTRISSSGVSRLRIQGNDKADIKSIRGFIYLGQGSDDSKTQKLMFISNLKLIRFHKTKSQTSETDNTATPDGMATKQKTDTSMVRHVAPRMMDVGRPIPATR